MDHIESISKERERQYNLPGTETDYRKTPNDWIATICSILGEGAERSGIPPSRRDFERSIVKAAAVCLAAMEHIDVMIDSKKLT